MGGFEAVRFLEFVVFLKTKKQEMRADIHTQEWIRMCATKVEKENPILPQPSTYCVPSTKRLDISSSLYYLVQQWVDGAQHCSAEGELHIPGERCREKKTSHRAVSSAKDIPVLLLAWSCARRHSPPPGF